MPPKPKKPVQSVKTITRVKKAVPKPKAPAAKKVAPTTRKPTVGKKPASTGDKTRLGPGPRPGSQSIPYQGPGPMGQGVY